ncbi:MAG: dihydroorotate dehydrogenase electron transfer subunit [Thermodesulfobacteriota bacterium]|nr:dihydroorotate dehydrogenase electron transfer subunit [Thermodesulfobacteriota bacterium]
MAIQTSGIILNNRRIKSVYFLLEIECSSIADKTKPGQFVMIKTSEDNHPLLRRPFTIYRSYSTQQTEKMKRGHLYILYKKVGKGTQKMAAFQKGEKVNLIGPLGKGFTLPPLPSSAKCILIGGGVGIASLASLRGVLNSEKLYVFIGGKTQDDILCENDFQNGKPSKVFIATEDGSRGKKGTVTDLFLSQMTRFDQKEIYYVYACGPTGMLKALSMEIKSKRWIVQASLETRMGCGIGACWGCVVRTHDPKSPYQRVCKEGPVFHLDEIVWE